MKKIRIISVLVAVMFFFTWVVPPILAEKAGDELVEIFKKDVKPLEDLLPEGVEVVEGFDPGEGAPIGTIKKIDGRVLVVHKETRVAYKLEKERPLFTGDMLISGEESSIQAILNDNSVFSLAPYSKMVLDKFIYDPDKTTRDSLLNLLFGKARFIVSKLVGGRDEDFRVKTPTAILGVRGSDFALSVVPVEELSASRSNWLGGLNLVSEAHAQVMDVDLATTVLTGEETTVGITGAVGPEQIMGPMSASKVIAGMAAIAPVAVTAAIAIGALSAAGPGLGALFAAGAGVAAGAGIGLGTAIAGGAVAVAGVAAVSSGGGGGGGTPTTTPTTTTSSTTTHPTTTSTTSTTTATTTTPTTTTTSATTTLPDILIGTWNLHGRCQGQTTDAYVIPLQINESTGGGFQGSGTGTDYTGELMDVTISGTYNSSTNKISGEISLYFRDSGSTRVDSFSTELQEDTGYFPLTWVSGVQGCPAEARLVKQ